jgi:uncharacterized membrane protein YfcA
MAVEAALAAQNETARRIQHGRIVVTTLKVYYAGMAAMAALGVFSFIRNPMGTLQFCFICFLAVYVLTRRQWRARRALAWLNAFLAVLLAMVAAQAMREGPLIAAFISGGFCLCQVALVLTLIATPGVDYYMSSLHREQ